MKLAAFGLAAIAAVALSVGSASAQYFVRGGHQHHNHGDVSPGFGRLNNYARPSVHYGAPQYGTGIGGYGSLYLPFPRGHYHYIPGHFDYHRSHYHYHPGHYDYHVQGTPRPRH